MIGDKAVEERPAVVLKPVNRGWLIAKIALSAIALLTLISLVAATFGMLAEAEEDQNTLTYLDYCDGDYYDRDFPRLYETLTLYGLYSEEYALYWEAVNGYRDFAKWELWSRAAAADGTEQSKEMADTYAEKVRENARSYDFAKNAKLLEGFLEKMEEAAPQS